MNDIDEHNVKQVSSNNMKAEGVTKKYQSNVQQSEVNDDTLETYGILNTASISIIKKNTTPQTRKQNIDQQNSGRIHMTADQANTYYAGRKRAVNVKQLMLRGSENRPSKSTTDPKKVREQVLATEAEFNKKK